MSSQNRKKGGSIDSSGNSSEEDPVLSIKRPKATKLGKSDSEVEKYSRLKAAGEKLLKEGNVSEGLECFGTSNLQNLVIVLSA